MSSNLKSDKSDHSESISVAFKDFQNIDPDIFFITEDGSKVYTHKIICSMYSPTFKSILKDFRSSEIPGVSLPQASPSDLINLLQILSEGTAFSTERCALLKVGRVAKLLGIVLEGMQLGKRKIKTPEHNKEHEVFSFLSMNEIEEGVQIENYKEESPESLPKVNIIKAEDSELNECIEEDMVDVTLGDHEPETCTQRGTSVKQFKCGVCEKTYEREIEMTRCQLSHTDGEQYPSQQKQSCIECGKPVSNLLEHTRTHNGEKPFKCDDCGKAYIRRSRMTRCKLKHAGELPSENILVISVVRSFRAKLFCKDT